MEKVRGFEIVSKYKGAGLGLPKRATKGSAGYDLTAAVDVVVPSVFKSLRDKGNEGTNPMGSSLIPTGVKAYMPENEYLLLANRSSNPMKRQLAVPNGIGVIDSDYYGNEGNEGEIFVQIINYGLEDVTISKGERIAQGIFSRYEVVDEEDHPVDKRIGGFGSSGR
ncbi:deoxyuridine 5'-triphosphate nucleotidohydrolase [Alkalibacterium subtropicum]|uniref:dUTP diphosphatase n=1 Tax=Alkalibacterium subtropicum TaxID=753702 RepID=A0A1I1LFZ9_9LACT|nr:dUTP diphosphatase [Alkalibacterium subtropicum]SFC71462.1 deoxyuridine 5'-triphosphate nucleotidohydrolase [Alkalibacterium subtropicum]